MLVKAYIEAGSIDKAINVYENITFWHNKRNELNSTESEYYEAEACKLIRTALIKNSEYKKAWNYYPLGYIDEDDYNNAQSRFVYLSDVVEAMCEKGKQEEARKFVDKNMRWFTLYVNNMEDKYDWQQDIKNSYNSSAVSEKLIEQIETSY